MYLLNFNLMSFICEWAVQTCFTKSIERKILHYNWSVLVEHIWTLSSAIPLFPYQDSPHREKNVFF